MKSTFERINWAVCLSLTAILAGCGGGDTDTEHRSREHDNVQTAQGGQDDLNYAPSGDGELSSEQTGALEEYRRQRENGGSGIVQVGGTEPGEGSVIQQAAGEGDIFDGTTIDGIPVFDEDDNEAEADAPEEKIVAPKKGSPEYYINEITKLRLARPPQTKDVEKLREWQHKRNLLIIEHAEKAIALTHRDPKQVRVFDVAVNKLLETRLQLAVDGDKDSVDALYEHADSLYKRDPESTAAADGAFTLVQLAFSNSTAAVMTGTAKKNSRWLQEFARQAEAFALKFPKEERRSIPLLFTAAETCELNGLTEEAERAYMVIAKRFPKHPASKVAVTVLRRMKMIGKRIKLSGTSLQGQKISLEQFAGKPIVVFFWSTEAEPSIKLIPEVKAAAQKYGKRLAVIGVCLDQKREPVDAFLKKETLPWVNLFHTDEQKRGWNNPIVKFYGVRRIPAMWVLDASGRVMSTTVPAGQLEATLARLSAPRTATPPRSARQRN